MKTKLLVPAAILVTLGLPVQGDLAKGAEGPKKVEEPKDAGERKESPDIPDLEESSLLDLDVKSPRFVAKDPPAFVVNRPGWNAKAKKALPVKVKWGKKEVAVDGGRWGFVNSEARKKRYGEGIDKLVEKLEKAKDDPNLSEEEKKKAEIGAVLLKGQKKNIQKFVEGIRCEVDLVENPKVVLRICSISRPALTASFLKDYFRGTLEKDGIAVETERPETWRGAKYPGYTFIGSGLSTRSKDLKAEEWRRTTYFMVGKKGSGVHIIFFECSAPKPAVDEQVEAEVDAFIRGTQFTD